MLRSLSTVPVPLGSNQAVKRVQFGPYAVDFRTGKVHKHGIRISLQEQPLQVLQLLIERQGDLLTREEARNRIWPGNTVADADAALSTAIRKIRTALADSAERPRYIETLPKRGYRFIALIEVLGVEPASIEAPPVAPPVAFRAAPFVPGRRRRVRLWATLAGIALIGLAAAWLLRPAPPPHIVKYTQMTNDGQEKIVFGGLVADGLHVYVNESESLVRISPQGGRATLIPASWTALGITPDGARLLVVPGNGTTQLDTPFWTLEAAGGQPRSMGISGTGGAWSPDGRRFAYSAKSALYIAKNDGADARKLADLNGLARSLNWSPDGASLRFDLIQPDVESTAVWEISTHGGNLHPVFSHGNVTVGAGGQWTSDGSYFLTWRGSPSGVDLWALRERGGFVAHLLSHQPQAFQLTHGPMEMWHPVAGRDPKKIFAVGRLRRGQVARYDPSSGQFLAWLGGISADSVVFSPDGGHIAWTRYPEGTLWRSRLDGSDALQLSPPRFAAVMPRWSPDGRMVAFVGYVPGEKGHWKIYTLPSEGGTPREMIKGDSDQGNPSWSPDGKSLLYAGAPWLKSFAPGSTDVRLLDLSTGSVSVLPGSAGLWSAKWSPDGGSILAETLDSNEIRVYDVLRKTWRSLVRVSMVIGYPWWSHDGKYVYFNSERFPPDSAASISRVRVSDSSIEEVLKLKEKVTGNLGEWFGLAPDDSILVLRDLGVQEVFELDADLP